MDKKERNYYLGIGSNIGDLTVNLDQAISQIVSIPETVFVSKSIFYLTKPWGYQEQPDFLNCAIQVKSPLSPYEFYSYLHEIEKQMGKNVEFKYGPRIIDIDILFCDDEVIKDDLLCIPHPLLHQRAFVLSSLNEIAPNFIHPILKKTIHELYKEVL